MKRRLEKRLEALTPSTPPAPTPLVTIRMYRVDEDGDWADEPFDEFHHGADGE